MAFIDRATLYGVAVGLIMGFIDTYGYAVSGYTTAEISLIAIPVLVRVLYGRGDIDPREVFRSTIIAYGITLSTVITSGMLITYALTKAIYEDKLYESGFPSWLYSDSEACFVNPFSCSWFYIYLSLASLSLTGVGFFYVLRHVFLDKLNLLFPLGIASQIITLIVSKLRNIAIYLPIIAIGSMLQFSIFMLGVPSIDLTPELSKTIPGTSLSLTLNFLILFLALILPYGTSFSIGFGSITISLVVVPLAVFLGLVAIPATDLVTIDDVLNLSAWFIASVMFGSILIAAALNIKQLWGSLKLAIQVSHIESRERVVLYLVVLGLLLLLMASMPKWDRIDPVLVASGVILVIVIIPVLMLLTIRGAGEAGVVSQAFYPLSTIYMYIAGFRGFAPYIYMDHYVGVAMPATLAASAGNIAKYSRGLGAGIARPLVVFSLSYVFGSVVTLIYGVLMLRAFGVGSDLMPLDRWVPYVTWTVSIYLGELDVGSVFVGSAFGVLAIAIPMLIMRYIALIPLGIIPFIIGMSLPIDYGIIFMLGSAVRWFITKLGASPQERLMIISSSLLAGSGLAVALYTVASVLGVAWW